MIESIVLHHTGRGKLWAEASKSGDWQKLADYYKGRVTYLIAPSELDDSLVFECGEPGEDWSKAVSSKKLKDQVLVSHNNKAAWQEQAQLLGLPVPKTKDWCAFVCREVIEKWPIYEGTNIPNSPNVMHIEIASKQGERLGDCALDYAIDDVLTIWDMNGQPQLYTHSVLEPKSRIRNGFCWDPPTSFLRKLTELADANKEEEPVFVPKKPTLEQMVELLDQRIAKLESGLENVKSDIVKLRNWSC